MPDSSYRPLPEHVTMPLLSLITGQSLDQDYAHVARLKREGGRPAGSTRSVAALVAALALFGLLVSTAFVQRSRNAAVDETSRAALISQIEAKRAALRRQQDRTGELRAQIAIAQQREGEALQAQDAALNHLHRLEADSGYGAVSGPGIKITIDDAGPGEDDAKVRDTDLALLADALWGVGAEAVSINGQRLTPLSAIRNANIAIHVNGRPLAPPYVVLALGDPRTLQPDLVDSERGQEFSTLVSQLGLKWDMDNEDSISLPGARPAALRYSVADTGVDNGENTNEGELP